MSAEVAEFVERLLDLMPNWSVETAVRVAVRLAEASDEWEFEKSVRADIASLPEIVEVQA